MASAGIVANRTSGALRSRTPVALVAGWELGLRWRRASPACGLEVAETVIMAKILLVEDNEMNRDMLSRRLERKGYAVVMAVDGEQGVAMAATELPELILMDMSLPVLDGWEATRRLKADARTRHIPIIALTAHAMQGDEVKAREAGCDDYDTKPVDLARLLEKIQALLARSVRPEGPD